MWEDWTQASLNADRGLTIIDGLMEYASDGRGQPSKKERALYMSAVIFAYAVWENYVEEAAIELVVALASDLDPAQLTRPDVRQFIESDSTVWELSVHPGWRELWVQRVRILTTGDAGGGFGLNTASFKNSRSVFAKLGIDPMPKADEAKLGELVKLRGEIVHTAGTTTKVLKNEVGGWRDFVRHLYESVDTAARTQCKNWVDSHP